MGSTLKGKYLLLREQILFFKSGPILRRDCGQKKKENNKVTCSESVSVYLKESITADLVQLCLLICSNVMLQELLEPATVELDF